MSEKKTEDDAMQLLDYVSHGGLAIEETELNPSGRPSALSESIPALVYYYWCDGTWANRELPIEVFEMRVGASSKKCEVKIDHPDSDPIQVVVRRVGTVWYIIEAGKNDLMAVDGFQKRQTTVESGNRKVISIGDTTFIFAAVTRGRMEAPEADEGVPRDNEYSIILHGKECRFPLEKPCLLGSHPLCDIKVSDEPFAALISHFGRRLFIRPLTSEMDARMSRDGQPIDDSIPLTPASSLKIDNDELLFKLSKDLRFTQDFKFVPDASAACLKLLELKPDGGPGESYALPPAGRSFFIGRDPSQCEIALSLSKKVSRKHAQVIIYDKMLLIMDMEARNGTYINGKKIKRKVAHPGDVVNFANVSLLLCYTG